MTPELKALLQHIYNHCEGTRILDLAVMAQNAELNRAARAEKAALKSAQGDSDGS